MFLWKHKVKSVAVTHFFSHIFQVLHLQSVSIFLGYPYKILVPFSVNCFVIPLSTLRLKRNRNNHFSDLNAKYIFSFVQPSWSFPQTTTTYAEFRSVRFIGLPSQNMPKRVSRLNNPWLCIGDKIAQERTIQNKTYNYSPKTRMNFFFLWSYLRYFSDVKGFKEKDTEREEFISHITVKSKAEVI